MHRVKGCRCNELPGHTTIAEVHQTNGLCNMLNSGTNSTISLDSVALEGMERLERTPGKDVGERYGQQPENQSTNSSTSSFSFIFGEPDRVPTTFNVAGNRPVNDVGPVRRLPRLDLLERARAERQEHQPQGVELQEGEEWVLFPEEIGPFLNYDFEYSNFTELPNVKRRRSF